MSDLGIYFGPKVIDVSEVRGKKLVNNIQIPLTGILGNELDEKVPAEVKLVASFNDAFRRNKIEVKEALLCLSGKDLIIRTFEIPVLPRGELHGAINFEAKKYIPFKIEELISDFQVEQDKVSRTNMVLFMGIKKSTFDKYFSILNQLNIKISAIEYSGFSALRLLRMSGIRENGIMGFLCFDTQGQDEINFGVIENGFPLFNRDINLSGDTEGLGQPEELGGTSLLNKLKAEIRVSFDYYHRKFPAKSLKNIYIISSADWRPEIEKFMQDLGFSCKFIDIGRLVGKLIPFSSSFVKSYGTAILKTMNSSVKLNLIESKARSNKGGPGAEPELLALIKSIKWNPRVIVAGVMICIATFAYGISQTLPLKQTLEDSVNKLNKFKNFTPGTTSEALKAIALKSQKTLSNLDNLVKKELYVTEVLDIIPRSLPSGIWLTKFSLIKKEGGKADLTLEGMSYLGDSNNEFQAVNKLFNNLSASPEFTKYFKDINIVSIDHTQFAGATVTTFFITAKTYKEAK